MTTIKQIAALAEVSRGTVDRVLNNRGGVNFKTAEKIKKIAEELDYKPNQAGLILAAQKKCLKLGVILFSRENPFFADVMTGIQKKADDLARYNCTVIIKEISTTVEAQLDAMESLLQEQVSGIALSPFNDARVQEKINSLFKKGIPTVTFNTDIDGSKRIAYVGSHYTHSGETAAGLMRLVTQGPLYVGIVTGSPNILCHTERIAGFSNMLKQHAPSSQIVKIIENHDDDQESYQKTCDLLDAHPEINALFFAAAGVEGGCRSVISKNLQSKIRIIAFDNVPATRKLVMQDIISATICQQPELQGSKPLDLLFSYLTTGCMPTREYHYVAADIKIKENIFFSAPTSDI